MNGTQFFAVLSLILPLPIHAQPHDTPPVVDVASVKLYPETNPVGTMMQELPGSLHYHRVNLMAVIQRAYGVEAQQIVAPPWMRTEAYEIEAKFPLDTPVPRLQLMLQSLLAERFHLQVHSDKKEMEAFELIVSEGRTQDASLRRWPPWISPVPRQLRPAASRENHAADSSQ